MPALKVHKEKQGNNIYAPFFFPLLRPVPTPKVHKEEGKKGREEERKKGSREERKKRREEGKKGR